MTQKQPLILVIEDDADVQEIMAATLEDAGFAVICTFTMADALRLTATRPPDLALVDASAIVDPAIDLSQAFTATAIPIIVTSGHPLLADQMARRGVPFLAKPYRSWQLQALARRLLGLPDPE